MTDNSASFLQKSWSALAAATLSLLLFTAPVALADDADSAMSFDGLKKIEGAKMALAYIDPDADFSVYKRVAVLDPQVSFQPNWLRDQNRNRASRVSARDKERIRVAVADLLKDVFIEALEANDGYEIVDVVGEDVLVVRASIVDLDVTAPDTNTAGRTRQLSTTAGSATIFLELFDSSSGAIIGRAVDRRAARRAGGTMMWSNRVTNTSEARRMMRVWADRLRGFLDSHYKGS
ncbi:MAG: DUF3313 family protein [Halieaceae bacterium]